MGNRYIKIDAIRDKIPESKVNINLNNFNLPVSRGGGLDSVIQKGGNNLANGIYSFAGGSNTKALGDYSHTEGRVTTASGSVSHAEGENTLASGNSAHAEGYNTIATGESSHAEGYGLINLKYIYKVTGEANATTYNTSYPHDLKVGQVVKYNNVFRHIVSILSPTSFTLDYTLSSSDLNEVYIYTIYGASFGDYSHTEGYYTFAYNDGEHAEGTCNISIENKTIHTVGIGKNNNARRNAHEIHKDGNHYIYGIGGYNGTNSQTEGVKTLQQVITELISKNIELTDTIALLETRIAALENIISQTAVQE